MDMAAVSCNEIKASEKQVVSGKYWLSTIKPNMTLLAHCDMNTGGMLLCLISLELPLDTAISCAKPYNLLVYVK